MNRRRTASHSVSTIRVGLLGLGTVGSSVAEILKSHGERIAQHVGAPVELTRAVIRNRRRKRSGAGSSLKLTTDVAAVIEADDIDIVVEVVGGITPAKEWIRRSLASGKPVVTANKAVLAAHGKELHGASRRARAGLYYEGAVAGGIPIVRTLRDSLVSDTITEIRAVLNGTTNFILGRMEGGLSYGEALAEAQQLGFAEADPTLDVNGADAADKLAILMQLTFGLWVSRKNFPVEGIEGLSPEVLSDAERLGFRVKLIATAEKSEVGAVAARVCPVFVPIGSDLAAIPGALNAVKVNSSNLGATLFQGPGAGGMPTGNAVVADIMEAARHLRAGVVPASPPVDAKAKLLHPGLSLSSYYLRLLVEDKPGVLAAITKALGENQISLETVLQRERGGRVEGPVPIVVTTFPCAHSAMERAIKALRRMRGSVKRVTAVRIAAD